MTERGLIIYIRVKLGWNRVQTIPEIAYWYTYIEREVNKSWLNVPMSCKC